MLARPLLGLGVPGARGAAARAFSTSGPLWTKKGKRFRMTNLANAPIEVPPVLPSEPAPASPSATKTAATGPSPTGDTAATLDVLRSEVTLVLHEQLRVLRQQEVLLSQMNLQLKNLANVLQTSSLAGAPADSGFARRPSHGVREGEGGQFDRPRSQPRSFPERENRGRGGEAPPRNKPWDRRNDRPQPARAVPDTAPAPTPPAADPAPGHSEEGGTEKDKVVKPLGNLILRFKGTPGYSPEASQVETLLRSYGTVQDVSVKGSVALVRMASDEQAAEARRSLDQTTFEGCTLVVNQASL